MKERKKAKLGIAGTSFTLVVLFLLISLIGTFSLIEIKQGTSHSNAYSDNGLTCTLPTGTPSYVSYLVPLVVRSSDFQNLANGAAYVYSYTDNVTNDVVTIGGTFENSTIVGGTTQNLPAMVEMGFYTYGANTFCGETGTLNAVHLIFVQVPIQNGVFNITGATYHISVSHY